VISISKKQTYTLSQEQVFMVSVLIVNGGNYAYNLILGRLLGPEQFSDAAVLITFLLVLSFVAMTFQLATAKFSVTFNDSLLSKFVSNMHTYGILIGVIAGLLTIIFADQLQALFHTSSSGMFIVFGIGIPLYFMMSVNRGVFQGKKQFKMLSITYQLEMLSRLVITLGLIVLFDIKSSIVIAVGILLSFGFGLIPFKFKKLSFKGLGAVYAEETQLIRRFFVITAFYEFTQIIINNSDILLVKHFFESWDAGLYAALALIGRIVYFIAWMFVMLLLPTVVQLKKEGKATAPILFKYVGYIACISLLIIGATAVFPEMAIQLLFGEQYVEIAPLLWKYALATGLFAIANIFAYYYLSLDKYIPVVISGVFGMLQMGLVIFFHDSLAQVVHMQIAAMFLLLATQVAFFFFDAHKK
jgi:O-antigen/teichoic acid export membrane protein